MEYQNSIKTKCLNSDIISTLPQNIIEDILSLIPIRDAVRTSVLSKKWRYTWRSMPRLVFTDSMVKLPFNQCCRQLKKYKVVNAILHVLLSHSGPIILEFKCFIGHLHMDSVFAPVISYLARGNKVTELSFVDVEVSAQVLQQFLSKCPLLDYLCLIGRQKGIDFVARGNKFTFVDLLRCVPLIDTLDISKYYMKYLCAGGMPHKLPASLAYLSNLYLDVCVTEENEISSALCMIMSSPFLEKITFLMYHDEMLHVPQTSTNFLDPEDYSDLNLVYLEISEIEMYSNLPLVMDFVKLIMAKSPVLKNVRIELQCTISVDEEVKMLKDMLLLPFPRASPSAKLIIDRA